MEKTQTLSDTLTCSICAKSCGNKKSQIRHISYCRRSKSRLRSRKKTCLNCTKAKTRCDLGHPSCSRCMARNLTCGYERLEVPKTSLAPRHISADQTTLLASSTTSTLDFASQLSVYEESAHSPLQSSVIDSAELVSSDFADCENWNLECTDTISTYMGDATVQIASQHGRPSPRLPYLGLGSSIDFSNIEIVDTSLFDQVTLKAPKSFWPRRVRDDQFSLNRNYVLCTLRSYPFMVLPRDILPPFIHPHCLIDISRDDGMIHKSLPEPLATCAAIVQMYSVKNESNAIFIWKTIRMEQEKLSAECSQYDDWKTVAALQAITVYFLLRLSENNDEATNFDIPLIYTMIKLAIKVNGLALKHVNPSDGSSPTWKGWALAESLRRTIIVLFLVDLHFDYSSALTSYKCDGSILARIALPCARGPWRATTSAKWKMEYGAKSNEICMENQLTFGDLLNWRGRTDCTLDSWLSQLDDFGTLVMAAASLPA